MTVTTSHISSHIILKISMNHLFRLMARHHSTRVLALTALYRKYCFTTEQHLEIKQEIAIFSYDIDY